MSEADDCVGVAILVALQQRCSESFPIHRQVCVIFLLCRVLFRLEVRPW